MQVFYIGQDDGSNVGPFPDEDAALTHFVEVNTIAGSPVAERLAQSPLSELSLMADVWRAEARGLVTDMDCFVWFLGVVDSTIVNKAGIDTSLDHPAHAVVTNVITEPPGAAFSNFVTPDENTQRMRDLFPQPTTA